MSKNSKTKKNPLTLVGLLLGLGLAGAVLAYALLSGAATGSAPNLTSASTTAPAAADAVPDLTRIAAEAKGFSVGPALRAHTTYVFFDTRCPHCAVLWENMKALEPQTRTVWIPVAVLGNASAAQGSVILSSTDPAAKMNEHEALMKSNRGGISAMSGSTPEMDKAVETNTKLFSALGAGGVPFVIARHAVTGETVSRSGSVPVAVAASLLGLNVPPQD